MKTKCLLLFSGGLDSILAAKILMEQKIQVQGITFKSYFFNAEQAKKAAKKIKLPLKIIDFSKEHFEMVKNPKYGYGKAINPCIDCHLLMLKTAKKILTKEKYDFIATGEVLGERPMSQNKSAMELLEKQSGLTGSLLRPLSAKLLEQTIPEKSGLINRKKLLDISGRQRIKQLALVKKYKIKEYPTPSGGCLLCDLEFSKRLKNLWQICPNCAGNDIELLKYGRHFWYNLAESRLAGFNPASLNPVNWAGGVKPRQPTMVKIIVGRNEQENKQIKNCAKSGLGQQKDILIEMKNYAGPITLIKNYGSPLSKIQKPKLIQEAKKLTQYYSLKSRDKKDVKFNLSLRGATHRKRRSNLV
ncbi:MAG: tRNA 4-thiouridine(8) synthase ThiI [Bacteroidota bacterium]|nr:tRNA 4-thiouridine(8) synthase ThiI [Bacteroidota bacterium]